MTFVNKYQKCLFKKCLENNTKEASDAQLHKLSNTLKRIMAVENWQPRVSAIGNPRSQLSERKLQNDDTYLSR